MGSQKISLGNTDLEHRPWRIYEEESRTLLVWHHLPPSVSSSRLWAENREDFLSFFFINLTFTGSSDAHGSTTTRRHLSPCQQRRKITKKTTTKKQLSPKTHEKKRTKTTTTRDNWTTDPHIYLSTVNTYVNIHHVITNDKKKYIKLIKLFQVRSFIKVQFCPFLWSFLFRHRL